MGVCIEWTRPSNIRGPRWEELCWERGAYLYTRGVSSLFTFTPQGPGDLWYFPAGMPHTLQATNDTAYGAEFLLVRLNW